MRPRNGKAQSDILAAFRMLESAGSPFTLRDVQAMAGWSRTTVARVLRRQHLWTDAFQAQLDQEVKHRRAEGIRKKIAADPYGVGNVHAGAQRGQALSDTHPRVAQGAWVRQQLAEIVREGLAKRQFDAIPVIADRINVNPTTLYYHLHKSVGHEITQDEWERWEHGVRSQAARRKLAPMVRASMERGERIQATLAEMVAGLKPGERLRARDIVKRLGLHHSSASARIKRLKREGVLDERGRRIDQ